MFHLPGCTGSPGIFYFGLDTLRTEHFEGLKHTPPPIDLPSPVTQIGLSQGLSAVSPDLSDILSGDTGDS